MMALLTAVGNRDILNSMSRFSKFLASVIFFALAFGLPVFAQNEQYPHNPRSAILDEAAYSRLPKKPALAARSYEGLPKTASLKQYAPLPGDQTDYGTCVAWASAYAARTISESIALNRKNQSDSTQSAFSPVYVYRNIQPDDPECQRGAQIYWALDLMKNTGAAKMLDIERNVDFPNVDLTLYRDSKKYTIADYVTLFDKEDRYKPGLVTRIVKKSLAEGKPVIIGMNTPDSFLEAKDIWQPVENPARYYGGHAMCVIGYDDERGDGGAFEILNSWGRKWGNGGFMWIPYRTFIDFVMESYEMIENLAVYSDSVSFAGSVRLDLVEAASSRPVPLEFSPEGFYKTAAAYGAGTSFRFYAKSAESAYLYVLAVSQTASGFSEPVQIFPPAGASALLTDGSAPVALPGENKTLSLDGEAGMEYLLFLYAKEPLNIRETSRNFASFPGTVSARLAKIFGNRLLSASNNSGATFSLQTTDSKAVAVLVAAIEHR